MPDIIKLLPDSVANQIAAGEVIQRPASVVKELVENAIDAGAKTINVLIKEAGRASIQVIDDGQGMSETDARMAFERHATSKISSAEDLFHLHSKGFRGEALASIAAVAQVELKTKKADDEVGTRIQINGSKVIAQEVVACATGTSFTVSNLFYNIPARRKFLKANTTEFRHIVNEFMRIAMVSPQVKMVLVHNDEVVFDLPVASLKVRITGLIGPRQVSHLLNISVETPIVKITGYIGKPEYARKRSGEQYFFANDRYMRHPYFHRAIMEAYNNLLPPETVPSYFIYFEVNPEELDVNIHPTKTEIKFENELAIWPILMASVKEGLGKFNVVPSIDFDQEGSLEIPTITRDTVIKMPTVEVNPSFNPFKPQQGFTETQPDVKGWEQFYDIPEKKPEEPVQSNLHKSISDEVSLLDWHGEENQKGEQFYQVKNRFIVTTVKSGIMFIDQRRAHTCILYERYLDQLESRCGTTQKLLFPEPLDFSFDDILVLKEILPELSALGFELGLDPQVEIKGIPGDLMGIEPQKLLQRLIHIANADKEMVKSVLHDKMAASVAESSAIGYGKPLSENEMEDIVGQLFACKNPSYTPDGKTVVSILSNEELIKRFL